VFRIRIRVDFALLAPDPYWNADPDPGARKLIKMNKKNLIFSFSTRLLNLRKKYYLHIVFFHDKINLLVTASLTRIRIRIGLAPWIRILIRIEVKSWIRIRIETNADPKH
jgi:hypothetical protein